MKFFRHRLAVTGSGATSFLQRMLSHDFSAARPGYGLLLEANGRLTAGAYWLNRGDAWIALASESMIEGLLEALPRYLFFRDEVEVQRLASVCVTTATESNGSWHDGGQASTIQSIEEADDGPRDPAAAARRRAGFPLLGVEFLPGDLPLDWDYGFAIARKGCFPGQEIVERMTTHRRRARGRILAQQRIAGVPWPATSKIDLRAAIEENGKTLALGLAPEKALSVIEGWEIGRPAYAGTKSMAVPFATWAEQ